MAVIDTALRDRTALVHRGRKLEYFTIAWNAVEGLLAVVMGVLAGSISLMGFGLDSFIEVTVGSVLLWNSHRIIVLSFRTKSERGGR